ncbi:MAG TPA: tRNA (guanine(10)-N(2))-dimethyltransferase [Methanoculleus sp.]|nr:tRNA (guanine(10)-N(2))-dimethyltransferase [Methanoculleus sp.]
MDLERIREGMTSFFAPRQDPNHAFPPASAAVFFNARMELNRDATVLLVSLLRPDRYLDAMGATGVRGLRIANECGVPVTINDRNSDAVDLIEQNAEGLGELVQVTQADINVLLSGRRFDAVDIDPFGTPAYFVDAAARSASRYLFVTATDTAPLCGAHLKAGMRRYFARPLNTDYHSEVGLRILLGFVAREVVKYDRGVEPLFCFAREHFVRLHLRLNNGAEAADRTLARIGFVHQCPACPARVEEHGLIARTHTCPECASLLQPIGPLWLGPVSDRLLLASMQEQLKKMELGKKAQLQRLMQTCESELDMASFYDYHRLAKRWRVSPPDIAALIARLQEKGFAASRTHHAGTGLKTDAPVGVLQEALTRG